MVTSRHWLVFYRMAFLRKLRSWGKHISWSSVSETSQTLLKWDSTRAIFHVMFRLILRQLFNKTPLNTHLFRFFSQLFALYYPCGFFVGKLVISLVSSCCFTSFVPFSLKYSLSIKSFQLSNFVKVMIIRSNSQGKS